MWTEYSLRSIRHNRAGSISLASISFVASAFLTVLCCTGYNVWLDHIRQIVLAEGRYTPRPEPLVAGYSFVLGAACCSLVMMLHSAFEIPMNSRIHQLGILQSVGATPKQIRGFLLREVLLLCAAPLLLGTAAGVGVSALLMQAAIFYTEEVRSYALTFQLHPLVVLGAWVAASATVMVSAYLPARKISRLTPLMALNYGTEPAPDRMKRFSLFSTLFGVTGELARKSLYARRRALRTSTLSLTFAFLALSGLLNIEAISGLSTQYTYFERFRDKWDILLTIPKENAPLLAQLDAIDGVRSCTAYQTASTSALVAAEGFSPALREIGLESLNEGFQPDATGAYAFAVPLYILDDASFAAYCKEYGFAPSGAVCVNKIWDSVHSSRKYREYLPLVDEAKPLTLEIGGKPLAVTSFAGEMPDIREEFKQYSLTLALSRSDAEKWLGELPVSEMKYNIFLTEPSRDDAVRQQISALLPDATDYTLESRAEAERAEFKTRSGLRVFICCFAGLLALIGLVNVFSCTLGQIYQRRREFARYLTVGLSPKGMRKILLLEAVVISLRPFLLGLFITAPMTAFALNAAEITLGEYLPQSPIFIMVGFTLCVFLLVLLAYALGGKRICGGDLVEVIKDETML